MSLPAAPHAAAVPILGQRRLTTEVAFAQAVCHCECGGKIAFASLFVPSRCTKCHAFIMLTGIQIQPNGKGGLTTELMYQTVQEVGKES